MLKIDIIIDVFPHSGPGGVMSIKYRVNYRKTIEAVLWLANEKPGLDIYHIGKAIFYAEKYHLNKHARPIIGDSYQKGEYGPFPSTVRDIIQQDPKWLDFDDRQESINALRIVKRPYPIPIPQRSANLDFFSKTDIECLSMALEKVGDMTFDQLKQKTHEEECFLKAIESGEIDYELLIEKGNPLRADIIEEMRETSNYVCL